MEAAFEKYITFESKIVNADDEDIMMYRKVAVTKDMTDNGPKAGEKFLTVDLHILPGEAVFNLKSGKCRIVALSTSGKKPPVYTGEFNGPPTIILD